MTLGLVWVYEGGFGPVGAHFGIALGVAGEALGILVRIVDDFWCPQEALGPSQGVQGCTKEAPGRHQGGTEEAPRRGHCGITLHILGVVWKSFGYEGYFECTLLRFVKLFGFPTALNCFTYFPNRF